MSTAPKLRADAAKNRERLTLTARDLLLSASEPVSLETIADTAGVGIGTLYRHFPSKEALVEAVYRVELDALEQEVETFLAGHQSFDAMRLWLGLYASFVATKHAMHDALRISITPQSGSTSELRARMTAVITKFLCAGQQDQSLRADVEPDDVTLCIAGAVFAATTTSDEKQLARILDLLMAALRVRT
ncbi:TetR family transcriptional regulator [Paracoccus kondratievae]|nr:TetR family transcriptional regulator [Paracoccus kondratievae]